MRKKFRSWCRHCNHMSKGLPLMTLILEGHPDEHSSYEKWYQYIGLEDRNGKEIYEGDIIQTRDGKPWLVEPIGSLERDHDNYGLCVSPHGNGNNYFIDDSILQGVVIGNLYENPELLDK